MDPKTRQKRVFYFVFGFHGICELCYRIHRLLDGVFGTSRVSRDLRALLPGSPTFRSVFRAIPGFSGFASSATRFTQFHGICGLGYRVHRLLNVFFGPYRVSQDLRALLPGSPTSTFLYPGNNRDLGADFRLVRGLLRGTVPLWCSL